MQYIEKVEISKFRSFGENNIIECGKINIFQAVTIVANQMQ